jgi:hypothetical protein
MTGYAGIVFMTPMAWLLAIPAGLLCVSRSESRRRALRLGEAALTGVALGLLEGLTCTLVIVSSPEQTGLENGLAAVLAGLLIGVPAALLGMVVCAILAVGIGVLQDRKRKDGT